MACKGLVELIVLVSLHHLRCSAESDCPTNTSQNIGLSANIISQRNLPCP